MCHCARRFGREPRWWFAALAFGPWLVGRAAAPCHGDADSTLRAEVPHDGGASRLSCPLAPCGRGGGQPKSHAAARKHKAPKNVPMLAHTRLTSVPERNTSAPAAEARNRPDPAKLRKAMRCEAFTTWECRRARTSGLIA